MGTRRAARGHGYGIQLAGFSGFGLQNAETCAVYQRGWNYPCTYRFADNALPQGCKACQQDTEHCARVQEQQGQRRGNRADERDKGEKRVRSAV